MPMENIERKVLYTKRKKRGECPRCGTKLKKSSKFSYCDDCRKFFRKYNKVNAKSINKTRKTRYEDRKDNHQCPRCGVNLGKKYTKTICISCLEKQYKYNYGKKRPKK
jgi:rubredoxin